MNFNELFSQTGFTAFQKLMDKHSRLQKGEPQDLTVTPIKSSIKQKKKDKQDELEMATIDERQYLGTWSIMQVLKN